MNVYIRNVDRSNYTINDAKFGGHPNLPVACPADSKETLINEVGEQRCR